jgi:hypothetical protein
MCTRGGPTACDMIRQAAGPLVIRTTLRAAGDTPRSNTGTVLSCTACSSPQPAAQSRGARLLGKASRVCLLQGPQLSRRQMWVRNCADGAYRCISNLKGCMITFDANVKNVVGTVKAYASKTAYVFQSQVEPQQSGRNVTSMFACPANSVHTV